MSTHARTETQDSFQKDAPQDLLAGLFNPVRDYREQKLKEVRAAAGLSPKQWGQLDLSAGITTGYDPDTVRELVADGSMPYNAGTQFSDDELMEQFVQSTAVDEMVGMGFGVNASLASYVYSTPLNTGRMDAETSMNARSRSTDDGEASGLDAVPLPIHHVDYELDARSMEVHRTYGEPLETRRATRGRQALNRQETKVLWNGWGGTHTVDSGTYTVGGLDDDSNSAIIQTTSTGAGWDDPAVLLEDANELHRQVEEQTDVQDEDDIPLVSEVGATVWVPRTEWGQVTREDYESAATDEPLITRLNRKYPYLNWMAAPRLSAGTAIMVLNDSRYFNIVQAQSVTNTAWDIDGGYATRYKLISSRVPFVRRQPDGIRGIVRMTGI